MPEVTVGETTYEVNELQLEALIRHGIVRDELPHGGYYADSTHKEVFTTLMEDPKLWYCDLCHGTPIAATAEAEDFTMGTIVEGGLATTHVSVEGWALCGDCAYLMEEGQFDTLRERVIVQFIQQGGLVANTAAHVAVDVAFTKLIKDLEKNWDGEMHWL